MRLLVAVDGSEGAAKAVREAGRLAAAAGASVLVVHQRSDVPAPHGPVEDPEGEAAAERVVDDAAAALNAAGVADVERRVVRGLAGEEARALLDVAREAGADIVVVGSRGLGRLEGLLLGSVSTKLVHLADRPVLVVR
ncbi:MAG: universal stress protein [Motilibacteraceae bacterium]